MRRLLPLLFLLLFTPLRSTEYVTVDFKGCQLGNQFFQIAAALSLAIDNNAQAVFPQLAARKDSGFPKNYREVFFRLNVSNPKLKRKKTYRDPAHHYTPIPYQPDISLSGYFQSEKYFKHNNAAILPLFEPSDTLLSNLQNKYGELLRGSPTVGVHLRSYLVESSGIQYNFPTYTREYYVQAMERFPEDCLFLIFSNDIPWAKKLLKNIPRTLCFIEGNDYIQDFYLLSLCDHQIISNSTFSWWAAYLNKNPEKRVVAPPRYFRPGFRLNEKDIFPEEWERIEDQPNLFTLKKAK